MGVRREGPGVNRDTKRVVAAVMGRAASPGCRGGVIQTSRLSGGTPTGPPVAGGTAAVADEWVCQSMVWPRHTGRCTREWCGAGRG